MNPGAATPPPAVAVAEWRFPNRATPPGSSAYYSIRLAPPPLRDPLAALFAWRHEIGRVLDDVSDPGVARLKLDWWRDEIRRGIDGAPRHPLSHVLAPALRAHALPIEPFLEQAQQVERELQARPHPDHRALHLALMQDRGALFELICRCHGAEQQQPDRLASARDGGAWCQQVRRLRDAGLRLRQAREVLPADALHAAGLTQAQLADAQQRQRLPALLAALAKTLRGDQPTPADTAALPRALRIQLRIHAALLDELARGEFDVLDQRIGLTPLRKLWLGWRTRP